MLSLSNILDQISNTNILVIGDIILDKYIYGKSTRISPEFPVPVVNITKNEKALGGSTNVARNLSTVGGKVALCGVIGNDVDGEDIMQLTKINRINSDLIFKSENSNTTVKTRLISNNSHLARIDNDIERITLNSHQATTLLDSISKFDIIIISDYNKGLINKKIIKKIVSEANKNNIKVYVDPKQNPSVYDNVNFATPNEREYAKLFLNKNDYDYKIDFNKKIFEKHNIENLIITRGGEGYTFISKDKKVYHGKAEKVDVFDICGAGDTFISYFALFNFLLKDEIRSLKIATKFASLSVTNFGIYAPSKEDLINIISYE